jgi:hydroxymethylbilane synthase
MHNFSSRLRIGTRESQLALAQANEVKQRLCDANPTLDPAMVVIVPMSTTGDRFLNESLANIGGKGLFTKEIEEALLAHTIDIAVHSMKDMPTESPENLTIQAILPREDPRDAFISSHTSLEHLPEGAKVGTSSLRRQAQLLSLRPDLEVVPIRGNVITRMHKLENGLVDATILAVAGLKRLHIPTNHYHPLSTAQMLPAVAQGALGVQCRMDDAPIQALLATINHAPSHYCVEAERAFLAVLDGSCRTPLAALATLDEAGTTLQLSALIASPSGKEIVTTSRSGTIADAAAMGRDAGIELKRRGGHCLYSQAT